MPVIIKDIKKNNNEIIRVEVSEYKGNELINIRIWYQAIDNSSGDVLYKPTQKGVTLNISEYAELKDAIDRIGDYINDLQSGKQPEQPAREIQQEENDEEKTDDEG